MELHVKIISRLGWYTGGLFACVHACVHTCICKWAYTCFAFCLHA